MRLTERTEGGSRIEIALEGKGLPRPATTVPFDYKFTAHQAEELRWYLEDFLEAPLDPALEIAARVEKLMVEIGATVFDRIFRASEDARDLWALVRPRLNDTRVEVVTGLGDAIAIPWEYAAASKELFEVDNHPFGRTLRRES